MAICGQVGSHRSFFRLLFGQWSLVALDFEAFALVLHLHRPTAAPTFVSGAYRAFDIEIKKKSTGKCMPNVCPLASPIYADIFLCLWSRGSWSQSGAGIKNIFIVIKRTFFYYYFFFSFFFPLFPALTTQITQMYLPDTFCFLPRCRSCIYLPPAPPPPPYRSPSSTARILFIDRDKRHEANFKR